MILACHVITGSVTIFLTLYLVTYVVAVLSHRVTPVLPFISYTGNFPIESCIFSFAFNFAAAALILAVIFRFLQVKNILNEGGFCEQPRLRKKINIYNIKCLVYGCLGSLGLSLVGSFQQKRARLPHLTGFFLAFIFIFFYMVTQTYFSFTCLPTIKKLKRCRLAFVVISSIIFFVTPFLFIYNFFFLKQNLGSLKVYKLFDASWVRTLGAFMEWILLLTYVAFLCSFYPDFKMISIEKDRIIFLK